MVNLQQQYMSRMWLWVAGLLLISATLIMTTPNNVWSSGFRSPDECLAFENDAHLNCLYAFIEIQENKIVELESTLNEQTRTAQRLQDDVMNQQSLNGLLQQRINNRENGFRSYRHSGVHPFSEFSYNFIRPRYHRRFFQPHIGFHFGRYYQNW